MQLRFFTVPIHAPDEAATELNRFLASHRILAIDRQLINDGANSAWTICVSFDDGNNARCRTLGVRQTRQGRFQGSAQRTGICGVRPVARPAQGTCGCRRRAGLRDARPASQHSWPLGLQPVVDLLQRADSAGRFGSAVLPMVVVTEMTAPPHVVSIAHLSVAGIGR
jgi:hypothetical protein